MSIVLLMVAHTHFHGSHSDPRTMRQQQKRGCTPLSTIAIVLFSSALRSTRKVWTIVRAGQARTTLPGVRSRYCIPGRAPSSPALLKGSACLRLTNGVRSCHSRRDELTCGGGLVRKGKGGERGWVKELTAPESDSPVSAAPAIAW